MLYLNPPFLMVNGLSVFADHLDPLQWYFMPNDPQIVVRTDGDARIPAFSLVRFKGGSGPTGGLLNFDVDLRVDADVLADTATQIRNQNNLRELPRLAPVPLEGGTVKLLILGTDTGAAAAPAAGGTATPGSGASPAPAAPGRFVVKAQHAANPSLYGDNQAAFSVLLDQDGAVLMERTLDGELTPIGVVYSLDYIGLRPAYNVRLSIDWDRVQEHLDKAFSANTLFVSSDITEQVDKLVDDRVIVLEVDTFVVASAENKGVIAGRDAAVAEVYDMITDAFFTASLDPTAQAPDGWDKATQLFDHLSPASQAKSLVPHFTYNRNESSRTDHKRLNVTLTERTAVKRSIYPQGHLSGVAAAIRDSGRPREDFVRDVDLDDPWFQRRTVEVIPRVDFSAGHVASASVELRYNGQPRSALFAADAGAPVTVDWASSIQDGRMVTPVEAEVVLNLTQVEDIARPHQLSYTPPVVEGEKLEVRTEELFTLATIPVLTDGVPWDRWSHLEVALRYVDEANGVRQESVFDLNEGLPSWNYQLFTIDPTRTALDYKLTYHGLGRQDAAFDWRTTDEGQVRIRNPFSTRRDVTFTPAVQWTEVDRVLIDARYADPANGVLQEQSYELTATDAASKTFTVDLRDPTLRRVGYTVLFLYTDGRQLAVPESATEDNRVIVSPTLKGRQVVSVRVDLGNAAALGVRDAVVTLTPGGSGGVPAVTTFGPGSEPVEIGFDFDTDPVYRYSVAVNYTNGRTREVPEVQSRQPELVIPLS